VRRRQQPVDSAFVGERRGVGEEGIEFGRRRRQADQVEARAAKERGAIGFGERGDPGARVGGGEDAVDRVAGGGWVLRVGGCGWAWLRHIRGGRCARPASKC
jgi:hypothetical protein